ncbi:MAG: aminotransferase class V-fold PLP-dependent enzyme [Eggerthellaceae bacterium]|nr:aminotransferase class V-fold PLP-dependent enzyme [Eggerthellaceae bacterium]
MSRASHQPPTKPVARTPYTTERRHAACARAVAVVLACETETTPLRVEFEDPEREPVVCEGAKAGAEGAGDTGADGRADAEGVRRARVSGRADADKPTGARGSADAGNVQQAARVCRPAQIYEGKPLVHWAVNAAVEAGVHAVYVLAAPHDQVWKAAEACVRELDGAGGVPVKLVRYDADADASATRAASHFELVGVTKGKLDAALRCLEEHDEADAALIMSSDQVRITADHLTDLCERFATKGGGESVDVVTSWVNWLRRTPLLVARRFLAGLDASGLCAPRPGSVDRPLPHLRMQEVVFTEEKLAANDVVPERVEKFFKDCTLSALEAVALARKEAAEAEARQTEDVEGKRDGGSGQTTDADKSEAPSAHTKPADRSAADQELIDVAAAVVRMQNAAVAAWNDADQRALRTADAWARRNQRDFPLLNDRAHKGKLAYLDSAATAQRLAPAVQAQLDFDLHENANIYRGSYALSAQSTATFNEARARIEAFIGADRRETVFTENTTTACNLVAQAWGSHNVGAGDVIVAGVEDHHSTYLPWLMLAERTGARVEPLPLRDDGRVDLDAYERLLTLRPKLVALTHVSNVIGIENPVREMAARAHEVGARVFVDAAQSIPHIPVKVKELGADFVAFSGHKLYGPFAIGCLWIAPDAFAEMDPLGSGGGAISHVALDSYYLRLGAIQYELGTPPIAQAVGLAAAVDHFDALGYDAVMEHGSALTRYAVCGLHGTDGVTVWGDHEKPDGLLGLVSFSLSGTTPLQVATTLGKLGVAVRAGGHCALPLHASLGLVGTSRISFGIHSTRDDVDAALTAIEVCRRLYANQRDRVRSHYADVAAAAARCDCCCDAPASGSEAAQLYDAASTSDVPLQAIAASRGCGDPVSQAGLQSGEVVLDLGSGGGIDALLASRLVGPAGRVYGVDMTPEMIELARANAHEAGAANVEFVEGSIDALPLPDASIDVVISNCVINLCNNKTAVFAEACRVLRPGGRVVVSDIVAFEPYPTEADEPLRAITGCRNGITPAADYKRMLRSCGFERASIEPKTIYTDEVLAEKAHRKGHVDALEALSGLSVGAATGSAIITAVKP